MPVFGIVPYRTEARTRSEARIQAEVDRLLLILKTVNEVIRTAEGRLIELFRPPPVQALFTFGDPNIRAWHTPDRAAERSIGVSLTKDPDWRWGDMQRGQESLRHFMISRGIGNDGNPLFTWGTLQ